MPTIVAFLDLLGFASYTQQDPLSAQGLLVSQQFILSETLGDGLFGSFQHFLTFSDSTFIVSNERDEFIRQLSQFLIRYMKFVDHAYADPEDPSHPENVTMQAVGTNETHQQRWYPPLLRGGLAIGELHVFKAIALVDRDRTKIPNLAGRSVVKAVGLEKSGRGPRLFCANDFKEHFGRDIQPYFQPITNSDSVSELLWPAFDYADGTDSLQDMKEGFLDLWNSAIELWKSKRGQISFEHYDEYLRLLIRSLVFWSSRAGIADEANDFAKDRIRRDLGEALIQDYLA